MKPDTLTLLDAVRQNLSDLVVPALTGADRYEALLAVSAIGIVTREMSSTDARQKEQLKRLLDLLDERQPRDNDTVETLERDLSDAIRTGQFSDPIAEEALLDYLKQTCRRTLALTNPKVAATYSSPDE